MIKKLLTNYGFVQTSVPNMMSKNAYKAVLWKGENRVTIAHYSPNANRLLDQTTYNDYDSLERYLKKNHS